MAMNVDNDASTGDTVNPSNPSNSQVEVEQKDQVPDQLPQPHDVIDNPNLNKMGQANGSGLMNVHIPWKGVANADIMALHQPLDKRNHKRHSHDHVPHFSDPIPNGKIPNGHTVTHSADQQITYYDDHGNKRTKHSPSPPQSTQILKNGGPPSNTGPPPNGTAKHPKSATGLRNGDVEMKLDDAQSPPKSKQNQSNQPNHLQNSNESPPSLSPLQIRDNPKKEEDYRTQILAKCQYPIKVIAFDLDKTLVRTISLHNDEQPQPEQYEDGYFMFFDDDTKEYHHVYKRPYLKELLEFLYKNVAGTNIKMMLCTHGTQKYAQTILERCGADKLFPIMLPRRDWARRKFEDDYKPRRFKTIVKMARSVNETVENTIMIDDDPGVYCKKDRVNGALLHILPFDDPFLQRQDTELKKLMEFLGDLLKYGKSHYIRLLVNNTLYTGITGNKVEQFEQQRAFLFRSEMFRELLMINMKINREERIGTLQLFDRFVGKHPIEWGKLNQNGGRLYAFYSLHFFVCLFMVRGYLYQDSLRPKQFRRDPYSSSLWIAHVPIYEYLAKKYGTLNGLEEWKPEPVERRNDQRRESRRRRDDATQQRHSDPQESNAQNGQNGPNNSNSQSQPSNPANGPPVNPVSAQPSPHGHEHGSLRPAVPDDSDQSGSNPLTVNISSADQQHLDMIRTLQAKEPHLTPQQRQWLYAQHRILQMKGFELKGSQLHRKKRKHRNHEKRHLFQNCHQLLLNVFDAVGYPKLLHGLFNRADKEYDNRMFERYEHFGTAIFEHAEKTVRAHRQQSQQSRERAPVAATGQENSPQAHHHH